MPIFFLEFVILFPSRTSGQKNSRGMGEYLTDKFGRNNDLSCGGITVRATTLLCVYSSLLLLLAPFSGPKINLLSIWACTNTTLFSRRRKTHNPAGEKKPNHGHESQREAMSIKGALFVAQEFSGRRRIIIKRA